MQITELPGCCAAVVLWDFSTDNEAWIRKWLTAQKRVLGVSCKLMLATTSTGNDHWEEDHRQNANNQRAAERALRAAGFMRTRELRNEKHRHGDTGIRLWWWSPGL